MWDLQRKSAVLSAISLGGLFFGLHSLLSDTSTMVLWVWEGYPIRGPFSNVNAWYTIFAMTAGVALGLYRPGLVTSWSSYGVACVGAATLTLYSHWRGYYGGLVLAVYLHPGSFPVSLASHPSVRLCGLRVPFMHTIALPHALSSRAKVTHTMRARCRPYRHASRHSSKGPSNMQQVGATAMSGRVTARHLDAARATASAIATDYKCTKAPNQTG